MTRDRVMKFLNELSAVVNQARGFERHIQQETAKKELAERAGQLDPKQAIGAAHQLDKMRQDLEKMIAAVCERANKRSLDGAEELLQDIAVRLDAAQEFYKEWRVRLAQLELIAELEGFDEENSRAKYEEVVASTKARYEAQLELAGELIPNKAVILSV